jgi:hypothetical protein
LRVKKWSAETDVSRETGAPFRSSAAKVLDNVPFAALSHHLGLFPDAEIAKYHVQDILDVHPTGQSPHFSRREPQFHGHQIVLGMLHRSSEGAGGTFQRLAMAGARDQRGLAADCVRRLCRQGLK